LASGSSDIGIVKATRPSKPFTSMKKLSMTLSAPEPLPKRPEEMRRYRLRTKVCTSYNMARKSVNYDKSTEKLSAKLADSFGLNADERHNTLREMSKMRLSQKELLQKIRRHYGYVTETKDASKLFYTGWSPRQEKPRRDIVTPTSKSKSPKQPNSSKFKLCIIQIDINRHLPATDIIIIIQLKSSSITNHHSAESLSPPIQIKDNQIEFCLSFVNVSNRLSAMSNFTHHDDCQSCIS